MWFRVGCVGACFAVLLSLGALQSDNQEAKSVLQRALKAMGDPGKLAKLQSGVAKGKVSGDTNGQEMSATFEGSWRGFDHYRIEALVNHGGQNVTAVVVINGDQAWAKFADKEDNPPAEVATAIKIALHALRMPQTLASLAAPAHNLSPTGEVKVADRLTVGLKVEHKDYKDVSLYFDKETGLPVKSEVRIPLRDDKDVTVEYLYHDYKDFDGVKQPGRVTIKVQDQDAKEFTMLIEHVAAGKQLPDSTFEKP
jgi:hypothetical protein